MFFILHLDFLFTYSRSESVVFGHISKCCMTMVFFCWLNTAFSQYNHFFFTYLQCFWVLLLLHNIIVCFVICKYIVYIVTKWIIYAYSYYFFHVTTLPNVKQHHFPNWIFFPTSKTWFNVFGSYNPQYRGTKCWWDGGRLQSGDVLLEDVFPMVVT